MKGTDIFSFSSSLFDTSLDFSSFFLHIVKSKWLKGACSDVRSRYSRSNIIAVLVLAKLYKIGSVRQMFCGQLANQLSCAKDVVYSVQKNTRINWRLILLNQCIKCYKELEEPDLNAQDAHQIPCFIADDTDIPKRGKCIEMIGKIFSHVRGSYPLGFKNLHLSLWTGKTVLHVDFSTHVESRKNGMQGLTKKELARRYSKERKVGSPGRKRVEECVDKKTTALIKMLKRALKTPLKAKYLLVDSWFFNSELVRYIKSTNLQMITRPKMNNWKYSYKGKEHTIGSLTNKFRGSKQRRFSRKLNMYVVSIDVVFKGVQLKMHLYKPRKRGSKWQVLITTDRSISAIRSYKIYQNRWAIEVSFKELKQHLQYGKNQSRDFVAQIADSTICLLTYNILSAYKCKNEYETLGALFSEIEQTWIKPTIMKRFWQELSVIIQIMIDHLAIDVEEIQRMFLSDDHILQFFNFEAISVTTET